MVFRFGYVVAFPVESTPRECKNAGSGWRVAGSSAGSKGRIPPGFAIGWVGMDSTRLFHVLADGTAWVEASCASFDEQLEGTWADADRPTDFYYLKVTFGDGFIDGAEAGCQAARHVLPG
jgi:hypothetical protein